MFPYMNKLELPAADTIARFGGIRKMAARTGRAVSTISSAQYGDTGHFPHWWTRELKAIAEQDGIKLPKPRVKPERKASAPKKQARAS
jgi:hypothetical protein